jgi:predicted PolB exonuclease-like 3'-5' exonuclease
MNVFVFDIETVPDIIQGKKLYNLNGLSDFDATQAMLAKASQQSGREFVRHYLQRIVAISVVVRHKDNLKVWSLGAPNASEAELIERFFNGIAKFTPNLVSWNGNNFDLPVLHYRALLHNIAAPLYWDTGEQNPQFKWNNYQSRFHQRHLDLMDVLAGYQSRAFAPLDEIAQLLGLPGKMGMAGQDVWNAYLKGEISAIRNYCETDVLNTYLIYLRFECLRGRLDPMRYQQECELVALTLTQAKEPHLEEFLANWQKPEVRIT